MQEQKKNYVRVYVGDNPNKVVKSSKKRNFEEKKSRHRKDGIHKEIMGEFSRLGIRLY